MPKSMPDAQRRAIVARLMLELFRNTGAIVGGDTFGPNCTDILLMAAVFIGQVESRPMNAGKLAVYAGIPRPTVVRRLAALVADGLVKTDDAGAFKLIPGRFANTAGKASFAAQLRAIHSAAAALSKLDT